MYAIKNLNIFELTKKEKKSKSIFELY